jgi:phosphohistidine phosphatase
MEGTKRTLALLRHAKSAWPEGVPDAQRPLATRGRRDAPAAGKWLYKHVPEIELVLCSPALRARETCDLAMEHWESTPEIRYADQLYGASDETLLDAVGDLPDSTRGVLIIGHNPGLEELASLLAGSAHPLKTSSIAVFTGRGRWNDAPDWARLAHSATPRGK